ncbi:MAG: DUF1566 domain-containing protein [Patescibacteria group bacterium]|nr:DUF1566 domain-containing protein [Patescibacteria group bacterium]
MRKTLQKKKINIFRKSVSGKDLLLSALVVILSLPTVYVVARAGSLTPTASPGATMHSLLEMAAKDTGNTFDRATDSLEAISEALAGLAAGVWDNATSGLTAVGSIGKYILDNLDTTVSSRAPASTALSTSTWSNERAVYLDYLDTDLKFLISSSTADTIPAIGSVVWNIGSSTSATSTIDMFGWFKNIYGYTAAATSIGSSDSATSTEDMFGWFKTIQDYTAASSTAPKSSTWTDSRAGYLDSLAKSGYDSSSFTADQDGNILELLKYMNNRNMFSVVNQKNGSAVGGTDAAFWTQALGGVDDYNDGGSMPTDSFTASWTTCTAANNYCKTGDSVACAGDVCRQDNSTGLIWSDYMGAGASYTWFAANNCYAPDTAENPGTCVNDDDDACQCVKKASSKTGCESLGDGLWRLPYQKELMQAYIDGSWGNLPHAGSTFWSSTTISNATQYAWYTYLHGGYTTNNLKTNTLQARCVR